MDVLAEIMSLLRTSTHLCGRLEFSAPFGFKFPGEKGICIIVTRGSCFLGVDTEVARGFQPAAYGQPRFAWAGSRRGGECSAGGINLVLACYLSESRGGCCWLGKLAGFPIPMV